MQPTSYQADAALQEMITVAEWYSPPKMRNSGFFHMLSNSTMGSTGNEFIMLTRTSTEIGIIAGNSAALAVVQNSQRAVTLMVYRESWEDSNYYGPRQQLIKTVEWRRAEAGRRAQATSFLGGPGGGQGGGGRGSSSQQSTCCNVY
jgi:hypothetical protein